MNSGNQNNSTDSISERIGIDTGLEKWEASQAQTQSSPIFDPGVGEALIIRSFTFFFNPETKQKIKQKKMAPPTRQELFNSVWPQIRVMLWGDGMVAIEEELTPPRLLIRKNKFVVSLLCKARTKSTGIKETIINKPKTLNEYLAGDNSKK